MQLTSDIVDFVEAAVSLGCAAVAWRTSKRQGGAAARWLAATFGVLGLVFLATAVLPTSSGQGLVAWARKVTVGGLVLFPYCLYRFTAAVDGARRRADRLAAGVTLAVVLVTAWLPRIPHQGESRSAWWALYATAFVVQWTALSAAVAVRLWRAGRGEATVARRRMQLMATGAVVLDVALLTAAVGIEGARLVGMAGIALLAVGFAPPATLRSAWRQVDARALHDAQLALLSATTATDVAELLLPHMTRLFGAVGSVLVDGRGEVVGAHGLSPEDARRVAAGPEGSPGVLAAPVGVGRVVVQASPDTPLFGGDEVSFLQRFAMFIDLALARAELLVHERAARERAEQAHAELETFVYTVSHDLKSPLMSMAAFLDLLRAELGEAVAGDAAFYFDRMEAGTVYMQALLHDLLELSRIGRLETAPAAVDLAALVREVADDVAAAAPGTAVVVGDLPVVSMNPLRARQLFTNLVANAVAHGGRGDVQVRVQAVPSSDGGVRVLVADDGVGIPTAHRERVFGVFERLSQTTGGSGIGLAVCRKIVEQAGGTIRVGDSVVGTTFEIELPAAVLAPPVPAMSRAPR